MPNNEEKLKIYGEALEDTIKKLAIKRTEMSTAAKTKLSDLQKDIPNLESTIEERQGQIASLNKIIEEKDKHAKTESFKWKEHYEKLCNELRLQHESRSISLNKKLDDHKQSVEDFNSKKSAFDNGIEGRRAELKNEENRLKVLENHLKQTEVTLRDESSKFDEYKEAKLDEIESKEEEAVAKLFEAENKLSLANKIVSDATSKKDAVDSILRRIKEVEIREKSTDQRESENQRRNEELNSIAVENKVERLRLNKISKELKSLDDVLTNREDNLKKLEAKVV